MAGRVWQLAFGLYVWQVTRGWLSVGNIAGDINVGAEELALPLLSVRLPALRSSLSPLLDRLPPVPLPPPARLHDKMPVMRGNLC